MQARASVVHARRKLFCFLVSGLRAAIGPGGELLVCVQQPIYLLLVLVVVLVLECWSCSKLESLPDLPNRYVFFSALGAEQLGRCWAQVAASEVRICEVQAPFWVLLPQEILCAAVARRATRSGKPETV